MATTCNMLQRWKGSEGLRWAAGAAVPPASADGLAGTHCKGQQDHVPISFHQPGIYAPSGAGMVEERSKTLVAAGSQAVANGLGLYDEMIGESLNLHGVHGTWGSCWSMAGRHRENSKSLTPTWTR